MADISFKKFLTFVDLEGEPTDEQIDEIFGIFRNNAKADKAEADRLALLAKKKDLNKQKDALFAKKKAELDAKNGGMDPKEKGSMTMRSQQAMGRAGERDWVANMGENLTEDHYDQMEKKLPGVNKLAKELADMLTQADIKNKFTEADLDTDAEIDIPKKAADGSAVHVSVGMNRKWSVVKVKGGGFSFGAETAGKGSFVEAVKKALG